MDTDPICLNCRHWEAIRVPALPDLPAIGFCRRYPPSRPKCSEDMRCGYGPGLNFHLETFAEDRCGEFTDDPIKRAAAVREKARRATENISKIVIGAANLSAAAQKMSDEQAAQIRLNPCGQCKGEAGLEHFEIPSASERGQYEKRWRVKCAGCGSMTYHWHEAAIAVSEWQDRKEAAA